MRLKKKNAGMTLVFTFIVLFLLIIIVVSIVSQLTYYSRSSLQKFYSACAFNLARSGIARAKAELLINPGWGQPGPVIVTEDNGKYEVRVIPDSKSAVPNHWKVISIGQRKDSVRLLTAWIKLESSLEYLLWSNNESSSPYGNAWLVENERFNGPCHTNGFFNIAGKPRFTSPLTSSNIDDPYYQESTDTYMQGGNTYKDNRYFYHYYTSYKNDIPVSSPTDLSSCLNGAVGGAKFPEFDKKWKQLATYKYEHDVVITFLSTGNIIVKYKDKKEDQISADSTIYVKGVAEIRGTVKGKPIIIAEHNVIIKTDITYTDDKTDLLSVISDENIILDTPPELTDININGFYVALGGTFSVKNYNTGAPRGTLNLFGGIMQQYASPVNTFSSGYTISTGFLRNFTYDPRCQTLPAWFPRSSFMRTYAFRDESATSYKL